MNTDHTLASDESKEFCDVLFAKLSELIPNLQRMSSKRWCGLFQQGRSRFTYVNHRKRLSRVEVWCLGNPADLKKHSKLDIEERQPTTGGFGKLYQARFFIDAHSQIENAVQTLYRVSFPNSQFKPIAVRKS